MSKHIGLLNKEEILNEYKCHGIVDSAISLAVRISNAPDKMKDDLVEEFDNAVAVFDAKKAGVDVDVFWEYVDALQKLAGAVYFTEEGKGDVPPSALVSPDEDTVYDG